MKPIFKTKSEAGAYVKSLYNNDAYFCYVDGNPMGEFRVYKCFDDWLNDVAQNNYVCVYYWDKETKEVS
jgi:hypothetical protein